MSRISTAGLIVLILGVFVFTGMGGAWAEETQLRGRLEINLTAGGGGSGSLMGSPSCYLRTEDGVYLLKDSSELAALYPGDFSDLNGQTAFLTGTIAPISANSGCDGYLNNVSVLQRLGDVAPLGNPDGQITVGDALVAQRIALGLEKYDPAADINANKVVNVGEVKEILKCGIGLQTPQNLANYEEPSVTYGASQMVTAPLVSPEQEAGVQGLLEKALKAGRTSDQAMTFVENYVQAQEESDGVTFVKDGEEYRAHFNDKAGAIVAEKVVSEEVNKQQGEARITNLTRWDEDGKLIEGAQIKNLSVDEERNPAEEGRIIAMTITDETKKAVSEDAEREEPGWNPNYWVERRVEGLQKMIQKLKGKVTEEQENSQGEARITNLARWDEEGNLIEGAQIKNLTVWNEEEQLVDVPKGERKVQPIAAQFGSVIRSQTKEDGKKGVNRAVLPSKNVKPTLRTFTHYFGK